MGGTQRAISSQVVHQLRASYCQIVVCVLNKTHYRDLKEKILTAANFLVILILAIINF